MKDKLKLEDDKLNQELGNSHGSDPDKIQVVFKKRFELYKRYLKKDTPNNIERLTLENKKEWTMSHLLNLIMEKELRDRITSLTKRVYKLEKAVELGEGA